MRNIGPTSAKWLADVGVETVDDLRRVGVVPTYAMIRSRRADVSLNLLWALEGALRDVDWRELSASIKAELRHEFDELLS